MVRVAIDSFAGSPRQCSAEIVGRDLAGAAAGNFCGSALATSSRCEHRGECGLREFTIACRDLCCGGSRETLGRSRGAIARVAGRLTGRSGWQRAGTVADPSILGRGRSVTGERTGHQRCFGGRNGGRELGHDGIRRFLTCEANESMCRTHQAHAAAACDMDAITLSTGAAVDIPIRARSARHARNVFIVKV